MKYFIGTSGKRMMMLRLQEGYFPSYELTLTFDIVECTPTQYYIFKYTKINMKAEDKFQWLNRSIKTKWGRFTVETLEPFLVSLKAKLPKWVLRLLRTGV